MKAKNYILIGIIIVVLTTGGYIVYQSFYKSAEPSAQAKTNCQSNADCEKYHACTEMICANEDPINEQISTERLKNCKIDITLYDPPGAFSSCECINNNCQFITQTSGERILEVTLTVEAPLSTATLSVRDRGLLEGDAIIYYEAVASRTDTRQNNSTKISLNQFNELTKLIKENNFWSFKEKYFEEGLFDATTYTLIVKSVSTISSQELRDAKVYSVSCYGECPEPIVEIINKIKDLWGREILQIGM